MKFLIFFTAAVTLMGCLSTEYKEYRIKVNDNGKGQAAIKFVNILSQKDDGRDVSFKDFAELISDYYDGDKILDEYPGARLISKDLYEENGKLIGEMKLEFDSLGTFKLFRFNEKSPYMLYVDAFSETLEESNGYFNREIMPVIFWEDNSNEFYFKTRVTDLSSDDTNYISLIEQFRKWKR